MVREELGPRSIWGWVHGVGLVQGVTRSGLVCGTPYGMASEGQEEPFSDWLWLCDESSPWRALQISAQILAGKFKMEFLGTVVPTKEVPAAQIRPNLHKIVSSSIRAFPVAHICAKSYKINSSRKERVSCCTDLFTLA